MDKQTFADLAGALGMSFAVALVASIFAMGFGWLPEPKAWTGVLVVWPIAFIGLAIAFLYTPRKGG